MVLKLKTPWRDGTTHRVMSPLDFLPLRIELPLCGRQIHCTYGSSGSAHDRQLAEVTAAKPSLELGGQEAVCRDRVDSTLSGRSEASPFRSLTFPGSPEMAEIWARGSKVAPLPMTRRR